MEEKTIKDLVLSEYAKGNIVVYTQEGLQVALIEDILKQPIEGLLYDLNRDEATILTFIEDPKWVNDYAMIKVVVELKKRLREATDKLNKAEEELKQLKASTI